jgi:hypothetical protein
MTTLVAIPAPGGLATVLTKRGPAIGPAGCYSPLMTAILLKEGQRVNRIRPNSPSGIADGCYYAPGVLTSLGKAAKQA